MSEEKRGGRTPRGGEKEKVAAAPAAGTIGGARARREKGDATRGRRGAARRRARGTRAATRRAERTRRRVREPRGRPRLYLSSRAARRWGREGGAGEARTGSARAERDAALGGDGRGSDDAKGSDGGSHRACVAKERGRVPRDVTSARERAPREGGAPAGGARSARGARVDVAVAPSRIFIQTRNPYDVALFLSTQNPRVVSRRFAWSSAHAGVL